MGKKVKPLSKNKYDCVYFVVRNNLKKMYLGPKICGIKDSFDRFGIKNNRYIFF